MEFHSIKDLILEYELEFFLKKNISQNAYTPNDIDLVYSAYAKTKKTLEKEVKNNKKQTLFYLEGEVKKMFQDKGSLTTLFRLDNMVSMNITRFEDFGTDWAYFDVWQKQERKKLKWKKFWERAVKVGTVLAYLLSISKLIEVLIPLF